MICEIDVQTKKISKREWSSLELSSHNNAVKADDEKVTYKEKRIAEYPDVGDQLDAIWKELNYRRMQGEALTQEADSVLNTVLAVKKRNPKK